MVLFPKLYRKVGFYESLDNVLCWQAYENSYIYHSFLCFTVCYAKNFGPKGIGFGGLTQVEKME